MSSMRSSNQPPNRPRPPPLPPPPSSNQPPKPSPPPPNPSNPPRRLPATFDECQLPSCKDGIPPEEERNKRRRTCRFIEEGGRTLRLPRVAVATAMVFFHRFYAKHSFAEHDRFEVAISCLLLAAKTEESPKKLAIVITECWKLKNRGLQQQQQKNAVGSSSLSSQEKPASFTMDTKSSEYLTLRERILLLERVILHTIAFELSIDHPYKFLVDAIKKLSHNKLLEYADSKKPQSSMMNELVQYAMNFANDSMHTSLCLQYPAKTIALTCVYLSAKHCYICPTGNRSWLDVLVIDYNPLCSICVQIMDLIADRRKSNVAVFQSIQSDLKKLKESSDQGSKKHSISHSSSTSGYQSKKPKIN